MARVSRTMLRLFAAFVGALLLTSTGSWADEADEPETQGQEARSRGGQVIEEIVVRSRKREESLQDVPAAIQAFTSADLARYSASDLNEISELATQVIMFPARSGAGAAFHIRGLGSTAGDPGIDSSVTINVDGMQINRGRIVRQGMFDLSSVQVLKGPQALFFGKNSPAGVVSLISNGPTDDWEFEAGLSFEFVADEFVGHAIASGPITDVFGFRLAYQGSTMEGFLKNDAKPAASPFFVPGNPFAQEPFSFPGALDDRKGASDEHIARLTLTYQPTDRFDATLKILATTYDDDGANVNEVISCSSGGNSITSPVASGITAVDPNSDCKLDGHTSQGAFPPEISASFPNASEEGGDNYGEYDSQIVTLDMNYELDNVTISAQVGWHYYDWLRFDNFDGTTFWQLGGIQDEESTVWSTEIRVLTTFDSPLNFMFGGFYENTDRDSDNFGKIAAVGADPTTGLSNNWSGVSTIEGDTLSGFGQLIWDVNERLELTAGARFTDEDKDMIQGNVFVNPQMLFLLRPVGLFGNDFDDTNWSPEVTVTWKASDDVTLYGAFKTGYKSGGFSTNTVITAGTTGQDVTFDEETSGGFEVGAKARLLEGALRANLTLYRYIFDDLQVQAFDSATTSFSIRNAAEAKTEGFELDVQWLATQALAVRGQVGFNSGRYEDFKGAPTFRGQGGGTQDLTDDPLLFAPDWNWSVGLDYDRPIGSAGLMLGLTGDVIFQDDYETMLQENPLSTQDSYFKLNASVRLSWPERGWEIALIGRNLTNERYLGSTADKPGGLPGDVFGDAIRARQVILQGTVNF